MAILNDAVKHTLGEPTVSPLNPILVGGGVLLPPNVLPYPAVRHTLGEVGSFAACHAPFIE